MRWAGLVAMQVLRHPRERKGFHGCSPITSLIWVKQPFESFGAADAKMYFDFAIKAAPQGGSSLSEGNFAVCQRTEFSADPRDGFAKPEFPTH